MTARAPAPDPNAARPAVDEILTTITGRFGVMKFRVRLYNNDPWTVALLTDLDEENPGFSITNGIEYAVAAVFDRWSDLRPARLIVVEHYDDRERRRRYLEKYKRPLELPGRENGESFDIVSFGKLAPIHGTPRDGRIYHPVEPAWRHSSKTEVEGLIGGKLP